MCCLRRWRRIDSSPTRRPTCCAGCCAHGRCMNSARSSRTSCRFRSRSKRNPASSFRDRTRRRTFAMPLSRSRDPGVSTSGSTRLSRTSRRPRARSRSQLPGRSARRSRRHCDRRLVGARHRQRRHRARHRAAAEPSLDRHLSGADAASRQRRSACHAVRRLAERQAAREDRIGGEDHRNVWRISLHPPRLQRPQRARYLAPDRAAARTRLSARSGQRATAAEWAKDLEAPSRPFPRSLPGTSPRASAITLCEKRACLSTGAPAA